jgi:GH15 family glucan-1,4-alpha-glucosidase
VFCLDPRIQRFIEISRQVISDCALENGAIVAANCFREYYPKEAKDYMYVWPRDASFTCVSADILRMENIQERFFDWCINRAEGFRYGGHLCQSYSVNGPKASGNFQPDQTGSLLWAIWHHFKEKPRKALKYERLIKQAADGLCSKWRRNHFDDTTNDLWEERFTFPDLEDNFTYSLAACIKGLRCANEIIPNKQWMNTADSMFKRLKKHYKSYFIRSYGKLTDERIDASSLGLVYPFDLFRADDPRVIDTVAQIEKKLVTRGGVHRYEGDEYDGWMWESLHRKKGAGAWPILNFWMSICCAKLGNREKALQYYDWPLKRAKEFLPEQIFENDLQVSVRPLCWSHAMFIIASKELGFIR